MTRPDCFKAGALHSFPGEIPRSLGLAGLEAEAGGQLDGASDEVGAQAAASRLGGHCQHLQSKNCQ